MQCQFQLGTCAGQVVERDLRICQSQTRLGILRIEGKRLAEVVPRLLVKTLGQPLPALIHVHNRVLFGIRVCHLRFFGILNSEGKLPEGRLIVVSFDALKRRTSR